MIGSKISFENASNHQRLTICASKILKNNNIVFTYALKKLLLDFDLFNIFGLHMESIIVECLVLSYFFGFSAENVDLKVR